MADKSRPRSSGGQSVVTVASSGGADQVIAAGGGRLCRVNILTAGSAAAAFFDSGTTSGAATAVMLFQTPASTNIGDSFSPDMPFTNGLIVVRAANTPGTSVSYNGDTVYGR